MIAHSFQRIPIGAIAWAVLRTDGASPLAVPLPGDLRLGLPPGTDVVLSARAFSNLELRGEAVLKDAIEAQQTADALSTYLALLRTVQLTFGTQGPDPDVKELFESLRVEREETRITVSATVPLTFLRKLAGAARASEAGEQEVKPETAIRE